MCVGHIAPVADRHAFHAVWNAVLSSPTPTINRPQPSSLCGWNPRPGAGFAHARQARTAPGGGRAIRARDRWGKIKLRRRHECAVAGWLPPTDAEPEALILIDSRGDAAGQVMVGPRAPDADSLRDAALDLAEPLRRKRRMRRLRRGLFVTVEAHGADGQRLRDP